ncbi:MAG: secretin N-terminal domain-containing protein [Betaproteobacteria bacterium]
MDMRRTVPGPMLATLGLLLLLLVVATTTGAQAQETVLEVIDLKYRSAEQIVPLLRPLLAPGGTLSALQNRLIVRTTVQNLAELRKVLDAVDRMPKRLVISVRQQASATGLESDVELAGSVGHDGARVSVPPSRVGGEGTTAQVRKGDNTAQVRARRAQATSMERGVQTVQVLEGNVAVIRVGQSVPVASRRVIRTPQGTQISESMEYRDEDRGFSVRPRLNGTQVTLKISSRLDAPADSGSQAFNIQHVDTVVAGTLGQWMEIGGVDQTRSQSDGTPLSARKNSVSANRKIFLKVDQLP